MSQVTFTILSPADVSCSQCPFTANNVEALNQHLQKNHKLLTYETRRHSSSFDSDSGDAPSQVIV